MKTFATAAVLTSTILCGIASAETAPIRKRFRTNHESKAHSARLADETKLTAIIQTLDFGRHLDGHSMSMSATSKSAMSMSMSTSTPLVGTPPPAPAETPETPDFTAMADGDRESR